MQKIGLLLVIGGLGLLAACGGGGSSSGPSTITSVSVSCTPSTINSGQNSQCSASVTGTGSFSTSVTWAASVGTITSSGLYTAPAVVASTLVTITATSTQDSTKAGTATIVVNPNGTLNNVQPIAVNSGPEPNTFFAVNEPFVSVTVCIPGTTQCQTIDNILLDTGSTGLRILTSVLTIPLPVENDTLGHPIGNCEVFEDGYTWGTVNTADIVMAGEKASSIPVQVILPPSDTPAVPSSCSSQTTGPNEGTSVSALGSNGIIGVGGFLQDCGQACVVNNPPPPVYYDCPTSGCTAIDVTLAQQVSQPVSFFATDNNGVLIQMASVPDGGSLTGSGSLIFGIGTESNNGLGSAVVLDGDNSGNITTIYNGQSYPGSFIDSGSNGIFFLNANLTGMPVCGNPNTSWYCPSSTKSFPVTNQGTNGATAPATFSIENTDNLFNGNNTAFSTLGGPNPSNIFDFGFSFFYGRNMFTGIETANSAPYFAY